MSLKHKFDQGQATVEMALAIPVLMLVIALVCQVALALNCYLVVAASSREGARKAAETNDPDAARKAALAAASGLPSADPLVEVAFPRGRSRGNPAAVTVTYRMPLLIPGLDRLVGQPAFKSSTTMSLEKSN